MLPPPPLGFGGSKTSKTTGGQGNKNLSVAGAPGKDKIDNENRWNPTFGKENPGFPLGVLRAPEEKHSLQGKSMVYKANQ